MQKMEVIHLVSLLDLSSRVGYNCNKIQYKRDTKNEKHFSPILTHFFSLKHSIGEDSYLPDRCHERKLLPNRNDHKEKYSSLK